MKRQTRRSFLKTSIVGSAGLTVLPNILPRSLFAADAPSKRINVVLIGCGREGRADVEGTHSSRTIMMSLPMATWVSMDFSGLKRCVLPST